MSDQAVLDHLTITQSVRFFWYEWQHQPPIDPNRSFRTPPKLHLIPSTPAIESQSKSLRTGGLVHLRGLLVEATGLAQLAQPHRHRQRRLRVEEIEKLAHWLRMIRSGQGSSETLSSWG
jgi:hypothetical protein